jgi:molybdenum cofactor biosynthesis protein A
VQVHPPSYDDAPSDQLLLTDTFGRRHTYLRISLTERCNLRCTYCMPSNGVELKPKSHIMTYEEILRLAGLFASMGVTKIRLTGGEPLIRKEIEQLVANLSAIPGIESLAITTNGLLLSRKLKALQEGGVTLFNISLDTLREDRFERVTRRKGLQEVLEAIQDALAAGYDPVKVNAVVMKGFNDDELTDFVAMTEHQPIEVRFIEYMPFGGNEWKDDVFMSYQAMLDTIRTVYPGIQRLDDGPNETSKTWQVPGFRGSVGFISSMSDQFCAGCNRIRLTADGQLKVCLFGSQEVNLRDMMRDGVSDSDLKTAVHGALSRKKASHAGMYEIAKSDNRPMILIGG